MEWLNEYHLGGIAIGICTFLIIGLFHPIVVKAEYVYGILDRRYNNEPSLKIGIAYCGWFK